MEWKTLLTYITGSVEQELLLRNAYLVTENRLLRQQVTGRIRLSDGESKTLAEIGKRLSQQALADVTTPVQPETILAWHRTLVAQKLDGSKNRQACGRLLIDTALEALVVRSAKEHRSWGYDRIAGALQHLGHTISDQTVGNMLKRHGIPPASERMKTTTWKEFICPYMDVLMATDSFPAEIWGLGGPVTSSVLFFLHLASRKVHIAGVTPYPEQRWMRQIARNVILIPTPCLRTARQNFMRCHERLGGLLRYDDCEAA